MTHIKHLTLIITVIVSSLCAFTSQAQSDEAKNVAKEPIDVEALLQEAQRININELTPEQTAEVMEAYGWIIAQQSGMLELRITDEEIQSIFSGIQQALKSQPPAHLQQSGQIVSPYMTNRAQTIKQEIGAEQTKLSEAFFEELKSKEQVDQSPSGLFFTILEPGEGNHPTEEDTVTIHYTGRFISGEVFDSSVPKGEPATFPVSQVIAGFQEGIKLLKPGGKATLFIPGDLGYGPMGAPRVPPNAALIFDVELIAIQGNPDAATAE